MIFENPFLNVKNEGPSNEVTTSNETALPKANNKNRVIYSAGPKPIKNADIKNVRTLIVMIGPNTVLTVFTNLSFEVISLISNDSSLSLLNIKIQLINVNATTPNKPRIAESVYTIRVNTNPPTVNNPVNSVINIDAIAFDKPYLINKYKPAINTPQPIATTTIPVLITLSYL